MTVADRIRNALKVVPAERLVIESIAFATLAGT